MKNMMRSLLAGLCFVASVQPALQFWNHEIEPA